MYHASILRIVESVVVNAAMVAFRELGAAFGERGNGICQMGKWNTPNGKWNVPKGETYTRYKHIYKRKI